MNSRTFEFRHRFRCRATCTLVVNLGWLAAGRGDYVVRHEGNVPAKPGAIREYRRWFLFTWQHVADETGRNITRTFEERPDRLEAWYFTPGQPPAVGVNR